MQPGTPRRVSGRKLVPGQVLDGHRRAKLSFRHAGVGDRNTRSFRLQVFHGSLGRQLQLLGQRLHAKLVPVPIEHSYHEEVAAAELVS